MRNILILLFIICAGFIQASDKNDIVGQWLTPDNQAVIQIELKDGEYVGKVLKLNPSTYVDGLPPKDIHNDNSELRKRSLVGVTLFKGLEYETSEDAWYTDQLYSPDKGENYEAYIALNGKDELKVNGFVGGMTWLGRTEIWRRVHGNMPF